MFITGLQISYNNFFTDFNESNYYQLPFPASWGEGI